MRDVMPTDQQAILADGIVGYGYGSGYGYGQMDLDTDSGNQSSGLLWASGQAVPFSITVADGTATFTLQGQQPLTYAYTGDLTDLFVRAYAGNSGTQVKVDNLVLNGDINLEGSGYALYGTGGPGLDILWVAGLNSDFTSLSGDVTMTFQNAGNENMSFQLLLGQSVDLSPVTVNTSMNTSGDVTVNWTAPNASTSSIQVSRSDDGGASFTTVYTSTNLSTTTWTDSDSDPNAIYQVTETEFATGWLKVASAAANVGPTVTVNLTDDDASAGVTFTADEGNSDLLDVYVGTGSSPTTQIDLSQISTLVVNSTVSGANLTFDGGLTCAVTVNGDGGTDSITLDAGNWGEGGPFPFPVASEAMPALRLAA